MNMTIIQFLEEYLYENPHHPLNEHDFNDISVTKFLQHNANIT